MSVFNWQMEGWPKARVNRAALRDELAEFSKAFKAAKKALRRPQDNETIARTLTTEAVATSAIEGVSVAESVVMSSICRALGVACPSKGLPKDARAEGVAQMMLMVREDWNKPVTAALVKKWHWALIPDGEDGVHPGEFRKEPVRVVAMNALGEASVRFEAPPPEAVESEIAAFARMWNGVASTEADIALKCATIHPHFESIHPFEDGNGRVGRAIVAKVLAEGLGAPLLLPISTVVSRHRRAYYDELNAASHSLDWTDWCAFFIAALAELLDGFASAARFVTAKRDYLAKYGTSFSERARKVILRMFEDGEKGVASGLSAAKWVRMAKVSERTADRDLAELVAAGALCVRGDGPQTRYCLNHEKFLALDGAIDGINEGIDEAILRLVSLHPGRGVPYFLTSVRASKATVERAVASLVAAGKIEHRGSKKTGGYYLAQEAST